MAFTAAQIRELQNKLGLRNPSSLFTKDWYRWFNRNSAGKIPCCQLRHTTPFSVGTTGTIIGGTALETVIIDTDKMARVGGDNGKITINTPGLYLCLFHLTYSANTSGNRLAWIMKNGAEQVTSGIPALSNAGLGSEHNVPALYLCNSRDQIYTGWYQDSPGALNVTSLRLSAVLLERI